MSDFECDNCGHEAQGYSKTELSKQGWAWHALPIGHFVMCDDCTGAAEQRVQDRRERQLRAAVPRLHCSDCGSETMVLPAVAVVVGTEFNQALPTALCRRCDRYPETLRPVDYEDSDWAMPDFFFPELP